MQARVTHATRGRVRLRVDGHSRDVATAFQQLQERTAGTGGITAVDVDATRGSALLRFDPEELSLEDVLALCREAHDAFATLIPPEVARALSAAESQLARRLRGGLGRTDRRILEATGGAVDLRMLMPMGLGALAVRQLVRTGPGLPTIPWYVLGWYAFDSFIKLHGNRAVSRGQA